MAFDKITQADLTGKGVIGLPDTPQLPTMQMQQKLDEIALDVIVPKFNDVVDKLNDPAGADDTQVTDPTTGLAGSLNDALQNIEDENAMNTLNRHNHANLGTLDAITAETKDDYDRLVALLGAITAIQNVLSGATDEIPTGKATSDAIQTVQDEVDLNTLARHTHDNKATLDDITAQVKQGYDRIVTLLTGITGVETTLTNANNKIARSDAVYTAISNLASVVALNTAARHTHANKATLDTIDALTKQGYDNVSTLLTGITGIEATLTNSNDKIARSDAVYTAIDNLAQIVALNTAARHTHANKATLDAIDALTKQAYDALVTTFSGKTVEQTVTNDADKLPSGAAVVAYVSSLGGGDMLKSRYDTNDDGTVDSADYATNAGDSTRLGGLLSSAYASTTDVQKLFGDIATYQGTSTVALKTYAIGDFMIYNNYFYEVIQGIPQGGSIVVNTNITQKTVGEVLARLGKVMTGATSLLNGTAGLVPAPQAGDEDKYLKGNGTWATLGNMGHTIWNAIKTAMTKRGVLWFKDAHVTDDAGNSSTDVEIITDVTSAQFTALATDGSTEGAYNITDENGIPVDASMIGYDNTQSGLSANNPQDAIDELSADKVNATSFGYVNGSVTITALNTPVFGDVTIPGVGYAKMVTAFNQTTTNAFVDITLVATNKVYFRVTQFTGTVGEINVKVQYVM